MLPFHSSVSPINRPKREGKEEVPQINDSQKFPKRLVLFGFSFRNGKKRLAVLFLYLRSSCGSVKSLSQIHAEQRDQREREEEETGELGVALNKYDSKPILNCLTSLCDATGNTEVPQP